MVMYPDQFAYHTELMGVLQELEGTVTHEYTLFNGFSVDLPQDCVDKFKEMNQEFRWGLEIEDDQEVHALGNPKEHVA